MRHAFSSIFTVLILTTILAPAMGQDLDEVPENDENGDPEEIVCYQPQVKEITIKDSKSESVCSSQFSTCVFSNRILDVTVDTENPDKDVVLIIYEVSGGKVNSRKEVATWDLTSVNPGSYMLTACADNGAGCMGRTMSINVFIDSAKPEVLGQGDFHGVLTTGFVCRRTFSEEAFKNQLPITTCFESDRNSLGRCESDCNNGEELIQISVRAIDKDGDVLTYEYKTSFGKIIGKGPKVKWDLSGATPGIYTVELCVDDGSGCDDPERWKKLEVTVQ
ncbi:MAG TPA: hypothetical protein VMM38_16125 [Aridibacter sp.]|nr:hypothetical protein [Aridibacter sp.]